MEPTQAVTISHENEQDKTHQRDKSARELIHENAEETKREKSYEKGFDQRKDRIKSAIEASLKTPYGSKNIAPLGLDIDTLDYQHFKTIPIINLKDVSEDPRMFTTGDTSKMIVQKSGGTTGKPKIFYYPRSDIMPQTFSYEQDGILEIADSIKEAKNPIFLHYDADVLDYDALKDKLRAARPDLQIKPFKLVNEALEEMKNSDFIFLESVVSDFRIFVHYFEELKKENPSLAEALKGKKFWLELNSEPVYMDELKKWHEFLFENFGTEPMINITYGQNDTGFLGIYQYSPGDTENDMRYLVPSSRLVEVVDEDGNSVIGERGDIIVTTLRTEGSVFIRYPSSDQGKLTVSEDGKMYLSEISRKPESGLISIGGHKFFVPELFDALRQKIEFPFKVEAGSVQNRAGETVGVTINLYSDQFKDVTEQEKLVQEVDKVLKDYEKVNPYFEYEEWTRNRVIIFNISAKEHSPSGFLKSWRVLPQQNIDRS